MLQIAEYKFGAQINKSVKIYENTFFAFFSLFQIIPLITRLFK